MIISDGSPASDALVALHAIGSHCTVCGITIDEVIGWEQCEACTGFVCGHCEDCDCGRESEPIVDDDDDDGETDDDEKLRQVVYGVTRDIVRYRGANMIPKDEANSIITNLRTNLLSWGLDVEADRVRIIANTPTPEELAKALAATP